jgi:phosphoribosylaminoimidazole-succinocarboxamide synthase
MSDLAERTVLSTDLPGALSRRTGKVRDIYDYGDGLLIVASDRISAFDSVMPNGIPNKGKVLTGISRFWFEKTAHIVPNHVISCDAKDFPAATHAFADILEGRSMWVRKAEVVAVECVVRGYLAGSGWKAYQQTGEILGHKLPPGLVLADKLPQPIFTPAIKAESGHDENISVARMAEILGHELADSLEQTSLTLFDFASELASAKGFLLCDTKFEFGLHEGKLILVDEIFTPDSSRWWEESKWQPGKQQESFDKQFVRDYLESIGWDKEPPAPELPPDVVAETRRIYEEALRRLTA